MNRDEHRAMLEEILAALCLIAGFLAHDAAASLLAKALWAYAGWNMLCAAYFWAMRRFRGKVRWSSEAVNDAYDGS